MGVEIAARNRKSLAVFHRTFESPCALSWGPKTLKKVKITPRTEIFKLGTEKAQKENPHKEFQRESGRGSGREVSGPEFFMLVSFSQQNTVHEEFSGGGGGLGVWGGGSKVRFSGSFLYVYVLFRCLTSEIVNFKRATHQTPIFLWGSLKVRIKFGGTPKGSTPYGNTAF